jgi:hypothetical protein
MTRAAAIKKGYRRFRKPFEADHGRGRFPPRSHPVAIPKNGRLFAARGAPPAGSGRERTLSI